MLRGQMVITLMSAMLTTGAVCAEAAESAGRLPELKFEKYKLANGMEVILHQDHSTPIVSVNLWYHVGSKNEQPGRTGFAHLFEHMMFQGSKHHDHEYFGPLQEAGGQLNGSTAEDRTNYWETVPSNYLELALWMESDRMAYLLPAMTQEKLDNQRDVVKNERRQSYENRPYGLANETILGALYPPDHPYHWPVIGSMVDLSAASLEDVSNFFRRFYNPANSSLAIAGDFKPEEAKRLVEKYFGSVPAGPKVEKMQPRPTHLDGEKRLMMQDRVSLPRLYMVWPTVPIFTSDDADLDVLASVLGEGKSSRLYQRLVYQLQIAQDVSVQQDSGEIASAFWVTATARPGHKLAELQKVIDEEIQRIQKEAPSAKELERAVNQYETRFIEALEEVGGFGGKADRLNQYNIYAGDPGYYRKDFERYLRVKAEDLQRVAGKYLVKGRVVLEVVPGERRESRVESRESRAKTSAARGPRVARATTAAIREGFDRSVMPSAGPQPEFRLPPIQRRTLSNGLKLAVVEHHELPVVEFRLVLPVGSAEDPANRVGLADMVAKMLDEGTKKRSALEIADELAYIGASLSVSADADDTVVALGTLKRHLERALDVYTDVLLHPTFPADELERQRKSALAMLVRLQDEPTVLASLAFASALYGDTHPYGRSDYGTASSVKALSRDDLVRFYEAHYRPSGGTLIVVGDVEPDELAAQLEKALADWKGGAATASENGFALPSKPSERVIYLVDKPGAAQSVIRVGQMGVPRNTPDYFPLVVMNAILGGQFSSRINLNLREEKGYTYGARSQFDWRKHVGPYFATASVHTAVTAPALVEFLKELEGIVGVRPVTEKELGFAKAYITRGYPGQFETPSDIGVQLATLVKFGLPDEFFNKVVPSVQAVTAERLMEAARKFLDPQHAMIVVVGDRSQIEAALGKSGVGKRVVLRKVDLEGRGGGARE